MLVASIPTAELREKNPNITVFNRVCDLNEILKTIRFIISNNKIT
jgi:hypothetical protein